MSACSFSSDAAGHLLSLDIDLYFNWANTTKDNMSITSWGHVSPRTFAMLLVNPFIPAQGIHYTVKTDKCNDELHAHMALEAIHRARYCQCACVSVNLSVCKRRALSLFFILGISALEGLVGAVKSNASRSHEPRSVIASLSAQHETSVWPFLNTQG